MTTIITRLYATKKQADKVVSELKANECPEACYDLVVAGKGNGNPDALRAKMAEAGVEDEAAAVYAERVGNGEALVVVRAPFGTAQWTKDLLDSLEPIDAGVARQDVYLGAVSTGVGDVDDLFPKIIRGKTTFLTGDTKPSLTGTTTPLSSMFGLPLLVKSKPSESLIKEKTTPLSSMFGLPLLVKSKPSESLIKEKTTPFSSMFGMPLLVKSGPSASLIIKDTTPFSSMFGLPLLTGETSDKRKSA